MGDPFTKKEFNVNWFMPAPEERGRIVLTDKDTKQIDWWCRHYKAGVGYLSWRMMEYFEAKDAGDEEKVKRLEGIIRACLPHYWEESQR